MQVCTPDFSRLTAPLGGLDCDANVFVTFRNPLGLQNWTLPVIEAVMVIGMVVTLAHAVWRHRRVGDSSNLVVWLTLVFALLLIEPIAYFPQWFGLDDALGLTFVHNQFSVQFLYDRLPLYIVAMYPAFGCTAYALVQRTGIFEQRNLLVRSSAVTLVFLALFEVVDTVAPQWRWWNWNTGLSTSVPALGVVPYLNIQTFCIGLPFGVTLLAGVFCRTRRRRAWGLVRDVVALSILVWPVIFVSSAPATVLNLAGVDIETARRVATWALVVVVAALGAYAFGAAARVSRAQGWPGARSGGWDAVSTVYAAVYLVAGASFWIVGLGAHLDAVDGVTPSGDPVGSLPVGAVAFVVSVVLVTLARLCGPGPARDRPGAGDAGLEADHDTSPAQRATWRRSAAVDARSHQEWPSWPSAAHGRLVCAVLAWR